LASKIPKDNSIKNQDDYIVKRIRRYWSYANSKKGPKRIRVYSRDRILLGSIERIEGNKIIIISEQLHEKIALPTKGAVFRYNRILLKMAKADLSINGVCPICNYRIVNGRCGC
jgi:hypothetical protein